MAALSAVVVFDEVLYKPGGQVHRWMTLLCSHFEAHAVASAPARTGELKAGISSHAEPFGPRQMRGTIASEAPHTMYVLRGTGHPGPGGEIYASRVWAKGGDPDSAYAEIWGYLDPKTKKLSRKKIPGVRRTRERIRLKGHFMAFGTGTGSHDQSAPQVISPVVSGQEPNNFLFKAWRLTARTHPSIRGLAPTASITDFPAPG